MNPSHCCVCLLGSSCQGCQFPEKTAKSSITNFLKFLSTLCFPITEHCKLPHCQDTNSILYNTGPYLHHIIQHYTLLTAYCTTLDFTAAHIVQFWTLLAAHCTTLYFKVANCTTINFTASYCATLYLTASRHSTLYLQQIVQQKFTAAHA